MIRLAHAITFLILFSFQSAIAQVCPVTNNIPLSGKVGDTLTFSTDMVVGRWVFSGPNGTATYDGISIRVNFPTAGIYHATLAGISSCEEVNNFSFDVTIFSVIEGGSVVINNGDLFTTKTSVTLTLAATNATEVLISNSSDCSTGSWSPYVTSSPCTLNFKNSNGRVYAKFRNLQSQSACVSDDITHDDISPIAIFVTTPPAISPNAEADFSFTATDSGSGVAVINCTRDNQPTAPCQSPVRLDDVSQGAHQFQIVATDRAGNQGLPVIYKWTVAYTRPTVQITKAPPAETPLIEAEFNFSGEAQAGLKNFSCAVDSGSYVNCTSPLILSNLNFGPHQFAVKAVDTLGQESTPAIYSWNVIKLPTNIVEDVSSPGSVHAYDLLFVMDNSPSMEDEQKPKSIQMNFKGILGFLGQTDWQIGVITTDAKSKKYWGRGQLIPFAHLKSSILIPSSLNGEQELINVLHRKEWGSSDEEGIRATHMAIARKENSALFRDGAALIVVIISDEDERSYGKNLRPENQPEHLVQAVRDQWKGQKQFIVHSVIWRPEDKECENADHKGFNLARLSSLTGGSISSVCRMPWVNGLKGILEGVSGRNYVHTLKCAPIGGAVNVVMNPQPSIPILTEVKDAKISFTPAPVKGTDIKMTYSCANQLRELGPQ